MMNLEVHTLTTPFVFHISVSCNLVKTEKGFVLIDTGPPSKRGAIEKELADAGCYKDNLMLIILTHGDFDHSGNAAYLRKKFGAKIAMHKDDSEIVERGDMLWNRNKQNILTRTMFKSFFRLAKPDRFQPDFYLNEGYDFSSYGFDAKVLNLPGHSKGSIGILTAGGDLFCGDLLVNTSKPDKNTLVDNQAELDASVEKLRGLQIKTVYPGHGPPFPMELFTKTH